jgi:hypothetical protein
VPGTVGEWLVTEEVSPAEVASLASLASLGRRFFRECARVIDGPWSIAVGTDLRFPEVTGPRTAKVRFVNAYIHRVHVAAASDPVVGAAFLRVVNLVDRPASLLKPGIVWRVWRSPKGGRHQRSRAIAHSG